VIGVPGAHVDIGPRDHHADWDHRRVEERHDRCDGRNCRR
jgi:hypothetical protein